MEKVPFHYTERACVLFFWFRNLPRKILDMEQSVATIGVLRKTIVKNVF